MPQGEQAGGDVPQSIIPPVACPQPVEEIGCLQLSRLLPVASVTANALW